MAHPYRTLPSPANSVKRKTCFFLHDWKINLKQESYDAIIRDSKKIKKQRVYFIDIFTDYNLKCACCGQEKPMVENPYYWQQALEDVKIRFKGFNNE